MKITTRQQIEIEVEEKDKIFFPEGLVGFEEFQWYAHYSADGEEPFYRLQSVDTPSVAFVVIDPLLFFADYDFEIDDDTIDALDLEKPEDVQLYVIVTVHSDPSKMTANLLAPIIINTVTNKARQIVLQDSEYSTRYRIFQGVQADDGSQEAENG